MKRAAVALLLLAAIAQPARAQNPVLPAAGDGEPSEHVPGLVRWGKWGAAAMFLGITTAAVLEHQGADDSYNDLKKYCTRTGPCTLGPDGRYLNPTAEAMYGEVVQGDRSARALFIAGQVALAGAAALFVIELNKEKGTRNIPYSGLTVAPSREGIRIGWRLPVRSP